MELLLIILFVIIFIIYFYYNIEEEVEGFECDNIYAKIYDTVFDEKDFYKNNAELVLSTIKNKKDVKILDIGCCTGKHYQYLSKYPIIGTDVSEELLRYAKVRNPSGKFIKTDLLEGKEFKENEFSHILCLHHSLYHLENLDKLLENIYYWLKMNGYLCIHIYNREKLDPAPRAFTQYYKTKDGIKHGLTYFNKFTHDSYWIDVDDGRVKYMETIVLEDGRKKNKETVLYIPKDGKKVVEKIIEYGFKLEDIKGVKGEGDMEMYIFRKIKFVDKNMNIIV